MAAEVWGDCDCKAVTEHEFGRGRVIWGQPLEDVLEATKTPADFTSNVKLNWIHRQMGDTHVYFVANETAVSVEAKCNFRIKGLQPELWNQMTGEISAPAVYEETAAGISVPLRLEASGSIFVVFRPQRKEFDPVVSFTRDGEPAIPLTKPPLVKIQKATYGVPGDAQRTRDVLGKLQTLADRGEFSFQVAKLAEGDDPAHGIVKTLAVEYTAGDHSFTINGKDPDTVTLAAAIPAASRAAEVRRTAAGRLEIVASLPGHYELTTAKGKMFEADITSVTAPQEIAGAWAVRFPPKWGAPEQISLDHLVSLSDSTNPGVKYFSGTATYTKSFDWNPTSETGSNKSEVWLDLGDVQVMAEVKLNGHDLGILWKPPFRVNIAGALKSGNNTLEIRVANLWPNRMIGDAALPAAERFTWSSYEPFTKDSPLPKSSLLGPVTVQFAEIVPLSQN